MAISRIINPIFTKQEHLNQLSTLVNNLFSSGSSSLSQGVSDYWIDQVLLKVNALSDTVFPTQKEQLRQRLAQAKQISKARNLLVGGNFETLNKWKLSRNAFLVAGHELFQGYHLELPPAIDSVKYPSYAYQKIDESKLKTNTRYYVSAFIAQGSQLEIMVSRYGQEYSQILYVPAEMAKPISPDGGPNCCSPHPCNCAACNEEEVDSHFFQVPIDVGNLQSSQNLGIEIGFKVASTDGFAKLSNIEVFEGRPLTTAEQRKASRLENEWKEEQQTKETERTQLLQQIQQRFNMLYTTPEHHTLRTETSYQHLLETMLPSLHHVYHWFMPDVPDSDYALYYELQQKLERGWDQYFSRNLLENGDFLEPLDDSWYTQGNVSLHTINNNTMLRLHHWDSLIRKNVSLPVVNEDAEYVIRVIGKGTGSVLIQNGTTTNKLVFTNSRQMETKEFHLQPEKEQLSLTIRSDANEFLVDAIEVILITDGAEEEEQLPGMFPPINSSMGSTPNSNMMNNNQ
ncbi:hypothetical protein QC456_000832 [Bacillus cereus]|nr:hypothetical protein [Bacillus cereus]